MELPYGTLSKVTDRNAKMLLVMLFQENQTLKEELEHLKARKGLPQAMEEMGMKSKKPNIIS